MGYILPWQADTAILPEAPTVVLDRVQDAGNVGSILRSASAFGFKQIIAMKGTAALWSQKVLRAGMGAHFALHLVEGWGLRRCSSSMCRCWSPVRTVGADSCIDIAMALCMGHGA